MSDVRSADFSMAFPGASELSPASAAPTRILVVDDDSHVARTLLDVLSQNGFQGTRADSGEAALEMLAKSRLRPGAARRPHARPQRLRHLRADP